MARRLLWWGDSPTAATGFGTVSRNVLHRLHATGEWDITVLGVNYYAQPHDYPYQILPAAFPDADPFGKQAFLRAIANQAPWDLIIINNDIYVVPDVVQPMRDLLHRRPQTRTIFYFPIDLKIHASHAGMLTAVDQAVCYSIFGQREVEKVLPGLRLAMIPHGCEQVQLLSPEDRRALRQQAFGIGEDTFLWMTCNRNSVRKDIARSIQAFGAFHSFQPMSRYYIHCQPQDGMLDMQACANEAGVGPIVAFPSQFSLSSGGIPRDMLMRCYQLADGFITTHVGEGWGLTVTEAMANGLPVVAPRNTTMPEILGQDYPYLYDCEDAVWVDNMGFRPKGSVRAIFEAMRRVHDDRNTDPARIEALRDRSWQFTRTLSWDAVGEMWKKLIQHVMERPREIPVQAEAV